jgi:hypothetical protein
LVTDCFYRDKFKNRFIGQKQWIFLFIHIYSVLNAFITWYYNLERMSEFMGSRFNKRVGEFVHL